MEHILTLSAAAISRLTDELTANPVRVLSSMAGVSRLPGRIEWLVHDVRRFAVARDRVVAQVVATAATSPTEFEISLQRCKAVRREEVQTILLVIGTAQAAGYVAAAGSTRSGEADGVSSLRIAGPAFPRVYLGGRQADNLQAHNPVLPSRQTANPHPEVIWSRSIPALGGEVAWHRYTTLAFTIVGCGRSGSLVLSALKRLGVARITIIDPDRIEPHNLGEMDVVDIRHLGLPKVRAAAESMDNQDLGVGQTIVQVAETVLSFSALAAIKQSDLVFLCVDGPAPRLATAIPCALYLKPYIDIAAGIHALPINGLIPPTATIAELGLDTPRQMGADIRLILPGRCLLCMGGIANLEDARPQFVANGMHPADAPRPWQDQRAGSLRSLNGIATGLATRLVEDFVGGRVRESTWLHLEIDNRGIPSIEDRSNSEIARGRCPLCALAGHGDEGLDELSGLNRALGW